MSCLTQVQNAKLKRYLARLIRDGTPGDPLVKGANYYINHREALCRFTQDGRLPLTNNAVEYEFRAVRSVKMGYRTVTMKRLVSTHNLPCPGSLIMPGSDACQTKSV